jgi:hypothetical protein
MRSQADEHPSAGPIAEFIFGDAGGTPPSLPTCRSVPIFRMGAAS